MKKLPEYFAIKRKKKDPRWKTYISWLNTTYSVGLDGTSISYPYYGFGGSAHSMDMYEASPSHFPNTPTVLTLDEFFECIESNNSQDANSTFPTGYTEIILSEFTEHVLNNQKTNNTMSKTYQVNKSELEQIHNVACSTWKSRIAELTLRNPFGTRIELTQTEVDEMFAAATEGQRAVLVGVFGEPNKAIDFSTGAPDGKQFFIKEGTNSTAMIAVRLGGDLENKAFYLNSMFNWEIKTDNRGETCLVPTRK